MIFLPLSWIFVRSLTGGIVPEDWHKASISALYKKDPRNLAENYRPVSLTSQICKAMESLIKDVIVEHLKKHNLIIDSQHGFRQGRSWLTNLLIFLEELSSYIDQGYPVDVIYLDFSKAFNKVPHQPLMIEAHGISGGVSRWIKAKRQETEGGC